MKNVIVAFSVLFLISGCRTVARNKNEINQQLDSKADKEIVLVKVIDDSRCPEGTQCIWAGEVTVEVAAYENKELVEQRTFTLNKDTIEAVKDWFEKHLPVEQTAIKEIKVLPYPKEGVPILPKEYKIAVNY